MKSDFHFSINMIELHRFLNVEKRYKGMNRMIKEKTISSNM